MVRSAFSALVGEVVAYVVLEGHRAHFYILKAGTLASSFVACYVVGSPVSLIALCFDFDT